MSYGKTFKQIRKGKSFTLKEAAGSTLSIAQLSRFENEQSMIPVDLFHELLQNVNTTPQEFHFLMGSDFEKHLRDFFNEVIAYNEANDYDNLQKMKLRLKDTVLSPYSWEQFLVYFIEALIEANQTGELVHNKAVQNYLMQVDDWGEMELRLYAIFGFVFDVETTYFLMKTALKKSKLYQSIPQDMSLLHTILTNNFSTFVYHQRYDYAEETILIFEEQYSKEVELLDPHLNFIFNRGILAFCRKNVPEGKKYCEQAIKFCQLFNQKKRGEIFQMRYNTWQEHYDDPDFRELTIEPGLFGLFKES